MAYRPLLREVRRAAGLTQHELADRLNVDQAVIARYETGAREPRVRAAVRIAVALDTTANALWPPDQKKPRASEATDPGHDHIGGSRCDTQILVV